MTDSQAIHLINGDIINLPQNGQETIVYQLPANGLVSFGFDTENAIFSADDNNLVISVEGGGSVVISGYQDMAQEGSVPTLALLGGEQIPGDVYLFVFNDGEELRTAAGGGAAGSGIAAYTDDSGVLFRSLDRLGANEAPVRSGEGADTLRGTSDPLSSTETNTNPPSINGQLNITMDEDGTYTIYDTDILSLVSDPDIGSFAGVTSLTISGGTLTEVRDGAGNLLHWTFQPDPDFNGELDINFTVSDTVFSTSGSGTLEVLPVNDAPVVEDTGALTMAEDGTILISESDILDGATDIDLDTTEGAADVLSVASITLADGTPGTLVNNGNGTWTFTPDGDWNGTVDYSFTITDGQGGTDTGSGSIVVTPVNDAPEVTDTDAVTVEEDGSVTIYAADILDGATDVDGDNLSVTSVTLTNGALGELVDNGNGSWTFSPTDDYNGTVEYSFTVSDGQGGTDTGNGSFSVTPVNDAPEVADTDAVTVEEDGSVTIYATDILDGATDVDGDNLSVTSVTLTNGALGELVDNGNGSWTFSPTDDYNGTVEYSFTVSDGQGGTDTGNGSFSVTPVNDAPELSFSAKDISTNLIINGSFEDVDIDSGDWAQGHTPDGWTKVEGDRWEVMSGDRYGIPGATDGENVVDFGVGSREALAISQTIEDMDEGEYVLELDLFDRGSNLGGGDSGSIDIYWNGELVGSINPGDNAWETGSISVAIAEDGTDGELLLVSHNNDGFGNVVDNVRLYPVGAPESDTVTVTENAPAGTVVATALAADVDNAAEDLSFSINGDSPFEIDATTGIITVAEGADIDFETLNSYEVEVSVSDGQAITTKTLTINVADVNEMFTSADVSLGDLYEDGVGGPGSITFSAADLIGSATDPDGDALSVTTVSLAEGDGTLTDNGDGTWTISPEENWSGDVSFDYTLTDGEFTADHSADLTVLPSNDAPILNFATAAGTENLITNGSFEDVVIEAGDWAQGHTPEGWTKVEGDRWEAMSGERFGIEGASDGDNVADFGVGNNEALVISQTVTGLTEGEYVLELDMFDRGANLGGDDSGSIDVYWNGELVGSYNPGDEAWETGSIIIDVPEGVTSGELILASYDNDAYGNVVDNIRMHSVTTAEADTVTVAENSLAGTVVATALAADIDNTATDLTFSLAGDSPFVIDPATGVITVAEGVNIDFETLNSYEVEVSVSDGQATTTKTLTINVGNVNESFTSTDASLGDIYEDGDGGPGSITFSAADLIGDAQDQDGDALSVTGLTLAAGEGTLTANEDGSWTFTPAEDWSGDVSFDYTLTDGEFTAEHSADLTVLATNDAPVVADAATVSVEEDGSIILYATDILDGATDVDGDNLSVTSLTMADDVTGELVDNGNGTWTFTPDADWNGSVNYSFTVSDGQGGTDTGSGTIEVTAVNDAPALSFAAAVNEGNFITNGSFEDVNIANNDWSAEAPEGWTKVEGSTWALLNENYRGVDGASDGQNVLDLALAEGPLVVSQIVNGLTEGQYVLQLDMFDRGDNIDGEDSGNVDVYWNTVLVGSFNPDDAAWETGSITISVPAGVDSGELVLVTYDDDTLGNIVDNLTMRSVTQIEGIIEIDEGAANGTYIATALGSDVDSTDLTFSIAAPDSPFAIDPETGVITVANSAALDGMETYQVEVTLADGDGGTTTNTLTVEVNEPPVGTDFTVDADAAAPIVIDFTEDVNVFDADGDVTGITIADTPAPSSGTLYFNGEPVEIGETYNLADGDFTFEANPTAGTSILLGSKDGSDLGLTNWGADSDKVSTNTLTQEVNGTTVTVQSGYGTLSGNETDGYSFAVDLDHAGKHLKQYDENANHVGFGIGDKDGSGIQSGESITVDFGDMMVASATIGFDGLGSHFDDGGPVDAKAIWIAMLDGEPVASGAIQSEGGNGHLYEELTITSDMVDGGVFDSIIFTTESGTSSNWELRFVEAQTEMDASFDYIPVDDDNLPAGEESTVTIALASAAADADGASPDGRVPEPANDTPELDLGGAEATFASQASAQTNMLGIYFVEDGAPANPEIILANSQDADMLNNVLKTFSEDVDVRFFLISDADGKGVSADDVLSDLNFVMDGGEWALAMGDKIVDVQFDLPEFNPDGEPASFRFTTNDDGTVLVEIDDQLGDGDDFDAMSVQVEDSDDYGASWAEGDAPVSVAGDVTINDDGLISGATITLTNPQEGDALNVGDLPDGMSYEVTEEGTTITVTLSGDFSAADYQDAISGVTFTSGDEPSEVDRIIEITVTDDEGSTSAPATSTISVDDLDVGAQIVLNPSFEAHATIHGTWDPTDSVDHWSNPSEGSMEIWNEGMKKDAPEGRHHMELDAEGAVDSLSQIIATKAGEPVQISFSFGPRPGTAAETNNFDVLLGGVIVATVAWNATSNVYEVTDQSGEEITSFGYDDSEHGWTTIEFEAVPTVNHAELTFTEHADGNDTYGAMIDNVQVVREFDTEILGIDKAETLIGTDGDDFILGADRDSIDGTDNGRNVKDDTIDGGDGDDAIYAGSGDDLLVGGDGNDFILGGGGDDTISGGAGDDFINPGSGNALITTGEGRDTIHIDRSVLADGDSEIVVNDFALGTDALELGDGMSVKDIISGTQDSIDYTEVLVGDDQGHDVVVKLLGVSQADLTDHSTNITPDAGTDDLIQYMIDSASD